ncbi:MAG TPA: DUF4956 domain-containing protein, partial [Gemmatimonadales bacterium]|nr:DUF4956 domain-containing protein [Gemmatimonadales bacterium]
FADLLNGHSYGSAAGLLQGQPEPPMPDTSGIPPILAVTIIALSAVALMLPVAWIYTMTRAKRGFNQSMVQTLLILPIVVAGVIVIVKNSIALAFGLAGIVTAVSFRIRLTDTKDAVYIFIAIGVGVACGVQAVGIATALSIVFNLVVLGLWWTDFGRSPAPLEGPPAELRLQRALQAANRTHQFVSMVDQEILRSLAPEQLARVADRVAVRQAALSASLEQPVPGAAGETATIVPDEPRKPMQKLRILVADGFPGARTSIEAVLASDTKKWEFANARAAESGQEFNYRARLKKKVPAELLERRLRAAAGSAVVKVEFE